MAKKRYQVYYTDTTHLMIEALEKEGHQQRDVINAGVVMFFKASDEERGMAHMTANVKLKERLKNALDIICKTNIELLSEEDSKIVQEIRRKFGAADPVNPDTNKKIS